MNDKPRNEDNKAARQSKADSRRQREARLAEALRANLKRRKAQERGRSESQDTTEGGETRPESVAKPAD